MRCVDAVAALVGGRKVLCKKLGLAKPTVSKWFVQKHINPRYVLMLVNLGEGKFTAEEFLGKFDYVD